MKELIYVSRASKRYDSSELKDMLSAFRRHNQTANISGLLLYDGYGTFIQVIEGSPEDIEQLYCRIKKDTRHTRINLLSEIEIVNRAFPDWKMGFKNLQEDPLINYEGFSEFMQHEDGLSFLTKRPKFALEMLEFFKAKSKTTLNQD
jgi:hypothetical protein